MAFSVAALVRSALIVVVAVLFVAVQMGGQSVLAARHPAHEGHHYAPTPAPTPAMVDGGLAYAPAPAPMEAGFAFALLPSVVAPAVMALISFVALKHL
jgi:hypothetical protein